MAASNTSSSSESVQSNSLHLHGAFSAILKQRGKGVVERAKKPKDYTNALYRIWHRCYLDKKDFGQQRLLLTQGDVQSLCQAQPPHTGLYVVPRQPTKPLSSHNAVVVNKAQRRFLLALWRMTGDEDEYLSSVEACRGSTTN